MFTKRMMLIAPVSVALLLLAVVWVVGSAEKPTISQLCKQCHEPDSKVLRGTFAGVSKQAGTIQMQVGPATWLVKFDDDTNLRGAEGFSKIPKEKEIAISIAEKKGSLYATSVSVKPPAKVSPEKLIKAVDLAKLVTAGPEKGDFTLVDSRPAPRYNEGFIPGAINIYDAEFDKNIDKLPKDKNRLLIFYCGGIT